MRPGQEIAAEARASHRAIMHALAPTSPSTPAHDYIEAWERFHDYVHAQRGRGRRGGRPRTLRVTRAPERPSARGRCWEITRIQWRQALARELLGGIA